MIYRTKDMMYLETSGSGCSNAGQFYILLSKGPFKRMQHVRTTLSNIVGHNMLPPFEHHVGTCWAMLDRVGRCWIKFDFCQTFYPTLANNFLRACALVDIYWYPVYPSTLLAYKLQISNRHFVWSPNFICRVIEYFRGKIIFPCRLFFSQLMR